MVNRTLRRPYNGTASNTSSNAGTDRSFETVAQSSDATSDGVDNTTIEHGENTIGDTERTSSRISIVEIDPEQLDDYIAGDTSDGSSSSSTTGKRRGRKPGSTNRKSAAKKAQDSIAPFVLMVHTMLAAKVPEMLLTPDEAERVSSAYIDFCEHHDIPVLSAKRMSEINLISMIFTVYGTRIVAIRSRMKEDAKVKKAKNVTPMQAVHAN
jgi:hypothetical protein